MDSLITLSRFIFSGFCVLGLVACGGGGGSDSSSSSAQPLPTIESPDTFYIAEQDTEGVRELYMVDSSNPGVSRKLNGPMGSGGEVRSFIVSPDGSRVVYQADQETDAKWEVFLVEVDNPGVSTKLNPEMAGDSGIGNNDPLILSSDGQSVFYLAPQDVRLFRELYRVDLDAPGVATKLNGAGATGAGISGFELSHGDDFVVYRATKMSANPVQQLYRVDLADPRNAQVISPPPDIIREVSYRRFVIRPDDQALIYQSDPDLEDKTELSQVYFDAPGMPERLNPPIVEGGRVVTFQVSSDGRRVVYVGDQDVVNRRDLYQVLLTNPGNSSRLNGDLREGGWVQLEFEMASNNSFVIYRADQETEGFVELYLGQGASPGAWEKLNGELTLPGFVRGPIYEHKLTLNEDAVIFLAEKDTAGVKELYRVSINSPGISTKISGPLQEGQTIMEDFRLSEDGQRVVYRVSSGSAEGIELYQVELGDPGVASRLNGPLVAGGTVGSFFRNRLTVR